MASKNNISIIIPTYTGAATLEKVLDSIRRQDESKSVEVVVVVDGPNKQIENILKIYSKEYANEFQGFTVKRLSKNKGRFTARFEGAKLAKGSSLLFIDDRTELDENYLKIVQKLFGEEKTIISNIVEKDQVNFVSKTLYVLRKKIYKNLGNIFKAYSITEENFDQSPKGTAGFGVKKKLFVDASEVLMSEGGIGQTSNDDTRLLREIVRHNPLYRSSEPVLFYIPRSSWSEELVHIYKRGPMFIDYYLKKGSPYFSHIIALYFLTFFTVFGLIFFTRLSMIIGLIAASIALISCIIIAKGRLSIILGLLLIPIFFVVGVYKGTLQKILTS